MAAKRPAEPLLPNGVGPKALATWSDYVAKLKNAPTAEDAKHALSRARGYARALLDQGLLSTTVYTRLILTLMRCWALRRDALDQTVSPPVDPKS
ncbi:hypothetical protein D3880_10515 [Pseudomonas cavernae]|uniref:Uncharacterized protein n=1 Tax=Pseudomonas cavernae TaxID=2320867 RepID=A0A385Z510_9PSED|nr:hypothetical protein [Pseudomonas cavernae]AYC32788.1 hypothetical protein D3880_10515 [Pseudomonas cavernae]